MPFNTWLAIGVGVGVGVMRGGGVPDGQLTLAERIAIVSANSKGV